VKETSTSVMTGVFALHSQPSTWPSPRAWPACTVAQRSTAQHSAAQRSTAQAITPAAPLEPRALPATFQKQNTRDTKPAAHARRTLGVPHLRLEAVVS
jgi:hypothetical protein